MSAGAAPIASPDDADDLRGHFFKQLLARPLTKALAAGAALAAGVAGLVLFNPAIGAAALAGGLLIALLVAFAVADSRSEDAFFGLYAAERQLIISGRRPLVPMTPLLRKGDDRYAERVLEGRLGDGVEGLIALFTYEEESTDSEGRRQTSYHRYTIGMTQVPESAALVPELYCRRQSGLRTLESFEDAFRRKERVKFESEQLDRRYEIFVESDQDRNWLRQLFSPSFIVWLTEAAPDKFGFELVAGTLCCFVKDHRKTAAELDSMRAATAAVATRLREESLE